MKWERRAEPPVAGEVPLYLASLPLAGLAPIRSPVCSGSAAEEAINCPFFP